MTVKLMSDFGYIGYIVVENATIEDVQNKIDELKELFYIQMLEDNVEDIIAAFPEEWKCVWYSDCENEEEITEENEVMI